MVHIPKKNIARKAIFSLALLVCSFAKASSLPGVAAFQALAADKNVQNAALSVYAAHVATALVDGKSVTDALNPFTLNKTKAQPSVKDDGYTPITVGFGPLKFTVSYNLSASVLDMVRVGNVKETDVAVGVASFLLLQKYRSSVKQA